MPHMRHDRFSGAIEFTATPTERRQRGVEIDVRGLKERVDELEAKILAVETKLLVVEERGEASQVKKVSRKQAREV